MECNDNEFFTTIDRTFKTIHFSPKILHCLNRDASFFAQIFTITAGKECLDLHSKNKCNMQKFPQSSPCDFAHLLSQNHSWLIGSFILEKLHRKIKLLKRG